MLEIWHMIVMSWLKS